MYRHDRMISRAALTAFALAAGLSAYARPAAAQEMLQLIVPQPEYTLGRFKYRPPQADGWRQMSVSSDTLSLVYAEKKSETDSAIDTKFGVAFEAHDIPDGVKVESARQLGEMSRTQISEARKEDFVSADPVKEVPSVPDMFMYRLLVHSPVKGDPDGYEVYFVLTSPDRKQYLVLQCITKSQTYENELYYTQFYGSLASLRYEAPGAAAATGATGATGAKAATGVVAAPGATGATAPTAATGATAPTAATGATGPSGAASAPATPPAR